VNLAKRSKLVYFKTLQYQSEANRFHSDFGLENTKKANFCSHKKQKCSVMNYQSFAISTCQAAEGARQRQTCRLDVMFHVGMGRR
jgi:hypothetical protein